MEKYRNKYRIQSNRMLQWDYSGNGAYFVTLVTQGRECSLGCVDGEFVQLSDFGKIVQNEWIKSFEIRDELFLDEYIIMPNHLHAIVMVNNGLDGTNNGVITAEAHGRSFPQSQFPQSSLIRKPKSISSFLAGFKSAVNSKIDDFIDRQALDIVKYNRNNHFFQPNYHDHIIRDYLEYQWIKEYIMKNPINWSIDKFYVENMTE